MSEGMIYMIYLAIPVAAILAIILVTAYYRLKDEGSVISEVFGIFSSVWENKEAESEKENASFYDICGYWNTSSEGYYDSILSKDENLFQEIGSLFGGK